MDVPIEVIVTEPTPRFCGGYSDVYIGRFGDKIVRLPMLLEEHKANANR